MRLVIHTQYYPPEMGAPQARLSALAEGMAARGHRVVVLTAMPNYPTGRVFPGYRGAWSRRERQGQVEIVRCPIWPSQSPRLGRRLASYLSFVVSSALVGAVALRRADLLLTESPPLFLGFTGWLLSRLKRARWIFNVSDLWPASVRDLGLIDEASLAYRLATALEAFCYRRAWLVSGQSEETVEDIRGRFPELHPVLFSNGVDTRAFQPRGDGAPESDAAAAECRVLYAGLHGMAQGLEQLLHAVARAGDERLRLRLVGDGPTKSRLRELAAELGLANVEFLPPVERSEIAARLAAADVAVVPLAAPIRGAVPSKLYEAMAAGTAVLLVAGGEAARLVERAGCGLVVPPGDVEGIATALRRLASDPALRAELGRRGRRQAVERYDRRRIVEGFAARLEEASNERRGGGSPAGTTSKSVERHG